jgi:hypothetical protein
MGLYQDLPNPSFVNTDPATQGLINQNIAQASRPVDSFAGDINKNVDQSVNHLNVSTGASPEQTGMSSGTRDALINAYAGQTGDYLNKQKATNQIVAEQRKANALKVASQLALHQQATTTNNYQTLTDAYSQMEAQRAAFVAQISGLASYGIGSYAGAKSKQVAPNTATPDQSMAGNQGSYLGNYSFAAPAPQPYDNALGDYNL